MDLGTKQRYLQQLADLKTSAQKNGINPADIDKKIDEVNAAYIPVDEESDKIETEFIKNRELVGKQGGMSKKQFVDYVNGVLNNPENRRIFRYNPELERKLLEAIGKNTKNAPTNYDGKYD
jgi:hypothetical protein